MKRIFLSLYTAFLLCSLFISCAGNQANELVYYNDDTLRFITDQKEKELMWTRELESVRLLKDISKNEGTTTNFRLSCQALCVVEASEYSEPVYPLLPGFSSLNTSSMMKDLRDFLDSFCSKVSEWKFDESQFESEFIFSPALFKFDVENQWENFFGVPFPYQEKKSDEAQKAQNGENGQNVDEGSQVFTRCLYGEPFFDEETIEVPVRFYAQKGSVDVLLYISKDKLKVNQLHIQKWNKGSK